MITTSKKFDVQKIPLQHLGRINDLVIDYIAGSPLTKSLYKFTPSIDSIEDVIQQKSCEIIDRRKLAEEIRKQYAGIDIESNIVGSNIDKLENPKTFVIVTAHQPCIFSGPLYFIYKIISALKMADLCNQRYPEYTFLPVFWIGGEDHDLKEVNHINIFDKKIEWNAGNQGAVGRMKLENTKQLIDEISSLIRDLEYGNEIIELIDSAYKEEYTLSYATRLFVHKLFKDKGLLIIDQDSKVLKQHFIPVIKNEIMQLSSFHAIQDTLELIDEHYKVQASPREINLFYLGEDSRRRIVEAENGFEILGSGISFSRDEIISEIEKNPERFSPNVILRPLYQQKILPAVAYVGGAGELSYWLQLKNVFEANNVCFPMLMLRDSAMIVDPKSSAQLKELGFLSKDMFKNVDDLIKTYVKQKAGVIEFNNEKEELKAIFDRIKKRSVDIDETLERSVEAEHRKAEKSIENIQHKVQKAQKREHETSISKIERIKEKLFPGRNLQERHENLVKYYAIYGSEFIEMLYETFDPFENSLKIFSKRTG